MISQISMCILKCGCFGKSCGKFFVLSSGLEENQIKGAFYPGVPSLALLYHIYSCFPLLSKTIKLNYMWIIDHLMRFVLRSLTFNGRLWTFLDIIQISAWDTCEIAGVFSLGQKSDKHICFPFNFCFKETIEILKRFVSCDRDIGSVWSFIRWVPNP